MDDAKRHEEDLKRRDILSKLTISLSQWSDPPKFNELHLRSLALYIKVNKISLSYDECKFLIELLPTNVKWTCPYEHLLYSRVKWEERTKLREHYGSEGYYHPSTRVTDKEMLGYGMNQISDKYLEQYRLKY